MQSFISANIHQVYNEEKIGIKSSFPLQDTTASVGDFNLRSYPVGQPTSGDAGNAEVLENNDGPRVRIPEKA